MRIPSEKMDAFDQKVARDIEQYGWSDIGVFPTERDREKQPDLMPWNYTVGLTERHHPELMVMGMINETGHGFLVAAWRAIERGTVFAPDTYATEVLEGLRVGVVEVLDLMQPSYPLSMVKRFYGQVPALQLVWPDPNDRFPWHEDFDPAFAGRQVLRGPWKGEM